MPADRKVFKVLTCFLVNLGRYVWLSKFIVSLFGYPKY